MQKMIKKYRKAKGFTLVELLIVIIIIGILAGMMMISSGSATDKAEATKILSNMRNIKAAAIMYYADHNEWPVGTSAKSLDQYLDQNILSNDNRYSISSSGTECNVEYKPNTNDSVGINAKLDAFVADHVLSGNNNDGYSMSINGSNAD